MEFLIGLFSSFLAIFGLGQSESVVEVIEPVAVEQIVTTKQKVQEEAVADSEMTSEIIPENTISTAEVSELAPEVPKPVLVTASPKIETMLVAGGCFWCVESDLEKTPGVVSAVSGYAGGSTDNPTYKNYGAGGHREVVEVSFDANIVSFEELLIVTLKTTDPTDDDGTFNDRGDKYSAAFYYENEKQNEIIGNLLAEVNEFGPYDKPLAIDVEKRPVFWPAEIEHQDYYKGTLTKLKYQYYRNGSGRNTFIQKYWGTNTGVDLPWRDDVSASNNQSKYMWENYRKPELAELEKQLDELAYKVTQEDGTERAGSSDLDKNKESGIYVDILSGEPLFSAKDKFDSGTGWPSFVKPITEKAVTEHEDRKLFSIRTEVRSTIADNHLGHVFNDGPKDRGGLRYCMNGVALRFIPMEEMQTEGYGDFIKHL